MIDYQEILVAFRLDSVNITKGHKLYCFSLGGGQSHYHKLTAFDIIAYSHNPYQLARRKRHYWDLLYSSVKFEESPVRAFIRFVHLLGLFP